MSFYCCTAFSFFKNFFIDRLPRDVAQEKLHTDIVRLLNTYPVRNNTMQGGHLINGHGGRDGFGMKAHTGNFSF